MVASAVYEDALGVAYPELAGQRVAITGLDADHGWDLAQAFAEHGTKLVLQSTDLSPSDPRLVEVAEIARGLNICVDEITADRDAVRFAQGPAMKAYSGLEVVINLVAFSNDEITAASTGAGSADIETAISNKLRAPTMIGRVAANRMRLTWTKGLVLNVVTMPEPANRSQAAFADVVHASVATWTRQEAIRWADQEIRVNAVAPQTGIARGLGESCITSEGDISALAIYLASKRGEQLTGHVFDAAGLATSVCSF